MFSVYASRAAYNRRSPHAFSYFCVARDLTIALKGHADFQKLAARPAQLPVKDVNLAAAQLLREHSRRLRAIGANKVKLLIK